MDIMDTKWRTVLNPTQLPMALTLFRLFAGFGFGPLILCHGRAWIFVMLLIAGLLSDIADGIIARRLGVATLALRRLDTRVDLIFYGCGAVAALLHASFPLARLLPWLVAYLSLFVARNLVDFFRYRASPSYHMWSGKLWSVLIFGHLLALFCGAQAFFLLPLAFGFYTVNAMEGIVASLVLPQPSRDIPSVWHALAHSRCA